MEEWKPYDTGEEETEDETSELYFLSSGLQCEEEDVHESFPVDLVPRRDYGSADVQKAMHDEINKYKSFNAFEEVVDEGQDTLPIRWVVTRHEIDGKNQPLKARMCIRGDLEKDKGNIRSDSRTVAYLQGLPIKRKLYARPPPEANLSGKVWLLKKGAYGISDGGRLFNLRLVEEMKKNWNASSPCGWHSVLLCQGLKSWRLLRGKLGMKTDNLAHLKSRN